jgi:hypothetical protein
VPISFSKTASVSGHLAHRRLVWSRSHEQDRQQNPRMVPFRLRQSARLTDSFWRFAAFKLALVLADDHERLHFSSRWRIMRAFLMHS